MLFIMRLIYMKNYYNYKFYLKYSKIYSSAIIKTVVGNQKSLKKNGIHMYNNIYQL